MTLFSRPTVRDLTGSERTLLLTLHSPLTGHLAAGPGQRLWCRGCGAVLAHPCPTRRVLLGQTDGDTGREAS